MTEYIEREKLIKEVRRLSTHYLNEWDTFGVLAAIDRIPAADVRPVVWGKWEKIEIAHLGENYELCIGSMLCDQCHLWSNSIWQFGQAEKRNNFCPNCGAMMEES